MRYEQARHLGGEFWRRLTGIKRGIKRETFTRMIEILKEAESLKKAARGKPNHLKMEDRLLMALGV